jgi:GLPGLI family protein
MKRIAITLLGLCTTAVFAQQKVITQATLTTKTTIVSPEGDDATPPPPPPNADGGEVRIVRFGGDGETKAITYLKNNFVKTVVDNEISISTTIRDNDKKITTTLMQMNGATTGFYATDEDQEQMQKKMDSLMQSRRQNGEAVQNNTPPTVDVVYMDESKKIAGIACKKALLITTRRNRTDSNIVWYAPDFKLQGVPSTGGLPGFGGGRVTQLIGLEKLNGFPMQYQMTMNRGRKMTVEVTKIDFEKEVKDKEFIVPKDIELKPLKDVQQMGGGRGNVQIRIGG